MLRKDLIVGEHYAYRWTKRSTPQRVEVVSLDATYRGNPSRYGRGVPGVLVKVAEGLQEGQEIVVRATALTSTWEAWKTQEVENEAYRHQQVAQQGLRILAFDNLKTRLEKFGIPIYSNLGGMAKVSIAMEDLAKLVEAYEVEQARWQ